MKRSGISYDMIGWQNEEDRVASVFYRLKCCDSNSRSSIAPYRFQHNGRGLYRYQTQLLGDHETVAFVADDEGCVQISNAFESCNGILDHSSFIEQGQKLLGIELT
jgi:hypothetical protein